MTTIPALLTPTWCNNVINNHTSTAQPIDIYMQLLLLLLLLHQLLFLFPLLPLLSLRLHAALHHNPRHLQPKVTQLARLLLATRPDVHVAQCFTSVQCTVLREQDREREQSCEAMRERVKGKPLCLPGQLFELCTAQ